MRRMGPSRPGRLIVASLCFGTLLALAGCGGMPEKGHELEVYLPGQIGSQIVTPPAEPQRLQIGRAPLTQSGLAQVRTAPAPAAEADQASSQAQTFGSAAFASGRPERQRMQSALVMPKKGKPREPKLIGMRAEEVSSLLGRPTALRREPPAQVWQYARGDCVLYVFLYRGRDETRRSRVRYIESRDPETAAREPTVPCLNQVIRHRESGDVS